MEEAATAADTVSVFTTAELERLLAVIPFDATRNLLTVLCWTGIRLGEAGLSYRKPYATRHTFASWMLVAGEAEAFVAQTMGHTSVQMIRQVYGHFILKTSHKWTLDDPQKYEQLKNQT